MSDQYEALVPARLVRDAAGTPYSEQYQDVYHARQGVLDQARHVFLHGNRLPERWQGRDRFTVCETGFGLGRNFLALWRAWRSDPRRSRRLHVLAFEAHPFSSDDLAQANLDLPEDVAFLGAQLVQAWPSLLPGLHRLEFESGALTLTLAFGSVARMAPQVQAGVDAFFLDGFTPRRNPEMWTPALFGQLVRIARPGATAASWCTSGMAKQAMRDAGFLVSKAPGFGGRRVMTVAELRPGLGRGQEAHGDGPVLVVGAGVAGASIAHALASRGRQVTVADPMLAQGWSGTHRGHKAVAVTPLLSQDDDLRTRLVRAGVLRALHRWQALPESFRPRPCGSYVIPKLGQEARLQEALARLQFPPQWAEWLTPAQVADRLAVTPSRAGVWFGSGQLVQPELLLQGLLSSFGVVTQAQAVAALEAQGEEGWGAVWADGTRSALFQEVVLANADDARALLVDMPGLPACPKLATGRRIGGQVSYFPAHDGLPAARAIMASEGYWLPEVQGCHTAGGTYWQDATAVQVTEAGHAEIKEKLNTFLNVNDAQAIWRPVSGWAGWRAVVAGRLPVIGEMPGSPGLWLACAFGSRGFTWAALAGDVIASRLHGEPQILERDLLAAVRPR